MEAMLSIELGIRRDSILFVELRIKSDVMDIKEEYFKKKFRIFDKILKGFRRFLKYSNMKF